MDAYKDEAHQMRAEAVRQFSGGVAGGIARLWSAIVKQVGVRRREAMYWLLAAIIKWHRARRAALRRRIRRITDEGLAAID